MEIEEPATDCAVNLLYRLIAINRVGSCTASYHLIIYSVVGQRFEDSTNGIDVCSNVNSLACQLFWGCEGIGMACSILKGIRITTAQIDEFDVVIDTGEQNVVRLKVKM